MRSFHIDVFLSLVFPFGCQIGYGVWTYWTYLYQIAQFNVSLNFRFWFSNSWQMIHILKQMFLKVEKTIKNSKNLVSMKFVKSKVIKFSFFSRGVRLKKQSIHRYYWSIARCVLIFQQYTYWVIIGNNVCQS